jgi:hypothetical protein
MDELDHLSYDLLSYGRYFTKLARAKGHRQENMACLYAC